MAQNRIVLLNAFNPLGTNMNPRGVDYLFDLWKDHAPANEDKGGQEVVFVGRKDKARMDFECINHLMRMVQREDSDMRYRRSAATQLLRSFCPFKTVECLIKYRKLRPDFAGTIAFDDEVPAWLSTDHFMIYSDLRDAVNGSFPNASVFEYGAMPTDFVRGYDKSRAHELATMHALGRCGPCGKMNHLYVPDGDYIKDVKQWRKYCDDNTRRWKEAGVWDVIGIVNPVLQAGPNWSDGRPVPPEIMAETIQSIAEAGFPIAIWQAGNTPEQFDTVCKAIDQSVGRAVAMVEGRKA